jgi:hypothetical protein
MKMQLVKQIENVEAPRSPEREALAIAIEVAAAAERAMTLGRDALDRGRALVEEAEAERDAAIAGMSSAREADADALVHSARTRESVTAGATRKARQRVEVAEDAVEVAQAALVKLESDAAETEDAARRANFAAERAVTGILISEAVGPLVERLEVLKSEIPSLQAALHAIRMRAWRRRGSFGEEIRELRLPEDIDNKIREAVECLPFNHYSAEEHPAFAALREACEVLRRDADAALPVSFS